MVAETMGRLNKRIKVIRVVNGVDDDGYPAMSDIDICAGWALVEDGSYRANEHFTAQAGRIIKVVQFTIRYALMRKYGIRPGMYIEFENNRYKILGQDDAKHARDYIKLAAEAEVVISG